MVYCWRYYICGIQLRIKLTEQLTYIFRSPLILLIAQSILYATGGIAFFLIGKKIKNKSFGLLLAVLYLWYPVAQTAVLFDIHGDTIAMPIIAWVLYAYTIRAWKSYYLLIILALFCKVYVAVPIVLMGLILWRKKFKKQAVITIILAGAWALFAVVILKNLFTPDTINSLQNYITLRFIPESEEFFTPIRWLTLLILLIPMVPYTRKLSIWLIPALGIVIPAFFLHGYEYFYHHYALAVPFIIFSLTEAYQNEAKVKFMKLRATAMILPCLALNLAFIIVAGPGYYLISSEPTNAPERAQVLIPWINEEVPVDAAIASSPHLSPFLSMRSTIYQTFMMQRVLDEPVDLDAIGKVSEYFVVDSLFEQDRNALLYIEEDVLQWLTQSDSEFQFQATRDGVFIFQKGLSDQTTWIESNNSFSTNFDPVSMDNGLSLMDIEIEAIYSNDGWEFAFSYFWKKTTVAEIQQMYAITSLDGFSVSRAFHLGSWVIAPVSEWSSDEIIHEFVYLNLPHVPGCYPINVGWYDPSAQIIAGNENAILGKNITWGYWLMEDKMGAGKQVDDCSGSSD